MDISTRDLYDAIVIGGGPAGMMAAIKAAKRGRKVALLEKTYEVGNKLLISGKGRCNLTNSGSIDKFLDKFSRTGVFLRNAFARFFNDELCDFFIEAGCRLKIERGGRVFPLSDKSQDVLDVLKKQLKQNNVPIKYNEEVKDVFISDNRIKCVQAKNGHKYFAPSIAVCTGGLSYPGTGSTGFGFKIAKKFGHTVIAPRPALVPVVTKSEMPGRLMGLSLENAECSVICEGKVIETRFGDMLFTHFGLSGPIIYDLSAIICDLLARGKIVFVSINLKPALDAKKIDGRLKREFLAQPSKALKNILAALLPKQLASEFLIYCSLDESKRVNQVTKEERKKIVDGLFDFRFEIIKTKSIKDAIITRGGVSTKEINPKTMESKIIKGVYFAGELIDVDAKTGGYNMQAAFSTGYVAGENL
jgi:predicted Rossmann fold flavoprotein